MTRVWEWLDVTVSPGGGQGTPAAPAVAEEVVFLGNMHLSDGSAGTTVRTFPQNHMLFLRQFLHVVSLPPTFGTAEAGQLLYSVVGFSNAQPSTPVQRCHQP